MFQSNPFLLPEFSLASETLDRDDADTIEVYSSDDEFGSEVIEDPEVVRFDRGGVPLWATPTPTFPPPCVKCGGKRICELQTKGGEASPDFATVYIFTCENSCPLVFPGSRDNTSTETYIEEFATFDPVP
ncbi:pcdc2:rp 8 programmed cell death protein 2 [Echinococcus multilocularis]|uniref:Pcdc2:rp 8 programmed cell death protein 2 n=1 Tax=Echinococcus multilocularis TaxID=6211 RepID=A0A068YE05_ECHMU|nr:pcdc2:rp 8 programmed cell death protein 2 [Echinococcus multilocularis]